MVAAVEAGAAVLVVVEAGLGWAEEQFRDRREAFLAVEPGRVVFLAVPGHRLAVLRL